MNKEKLTMIKKQIKTYAPAAAVVAASIALAAVIYKLADSAIQAEVSEEDYDVFEVIDGEEKTTLLGREDTILQKVEDDFYFLSVGYPKTED